MLFKKYCYFFYYNDDFYIKENIIEKNYYLLYYYKSWDLLIFLINKLNKIYLNVVLEHCCEFKRTDIIYYILTNYKDNINYDLLLYNLCSSDIEDKNKTLDYLIDNDLISKTEQNLVIISTNININQIKKFMKKINISDDKTKRIFIEVIENNIKILDFNSLL